MRVGLVALQISKFRRRKFQKSLPNSTVNIPIQLLQNISSKTYSIEEKNCFKMATMKEENVLFC